MNMPVKINKAMMLAAGYGTRLKPLTDRVPKPLVPVAGRPMIDYALEKLQAYGIHEIVINVSHLKEQLIAHLAEWKNLTIKISEEAEPLETGGGLKKAQAAAGQRTGLRHQQRHHLVGRFSVGTTDFSLSAAKRGRGPG